MNVLEVVVMVAGATVVGRSVGDRVVGLNVGTRVVGRIDGDATVTISVLVSVLEVVVTDEDDTLFRGQALRSAQQRTATSVSIGKHVGGNCCNDVDEPAAAILLPSGHNVDVHTRLLSNPQPVPRAESPIISASVQSRPPASERQRSTAEVKLALAWQAPCMIDSPHTLFTSFPNL